MDISTHYILSIDFGQKSKVPISDSKWQKIEPNYLLYIYAQVQRNQIFDKNIRFTSSTKNDNKIDSGGKKSIFGRKNTNNDKKLAPMVRDR